VASDLLGDDVIRLTYVPAWLRDSPDAVRRCVRCDLGRERKFKLRHYRFERILDAIYRFRQTGRFNQERETR